MSRHHRRQKWSTHSPKFRAVWLRLLPQPCWHCGQAVTKADKWHVGHKTAAEAGGQPTLANTAPVHSTCNLRDGGRRGAAITNSRKVSRLHESEEIRPW